jgi:peptide/nickel transport system substrate-binding protein
VRGSQATYERNPNYWGKTTIDGKEYQTPFIDKMIWPVIADESTQIASLRTGKIDWAEAVSPRYGETLAKTSPDLVKYPYLLSGSLVVALQSSTDEIFKNEALRRAMMIGTDLETIGKNAWGEGNYDINPLVRGSALYTPIAQMPPSTKELFTYDMAKAKKMLADAGYGGGFEMEMTYAPSQTNFQAEDIASMIVDMWSKIGIKVKLNPVEAPVLTNLVYGHTYTDALLCGRAYMTGGVSMAMGVKGHEENTGDWENAAYTEAYNKAFSERDPVKSLAIKKEMAIQLLNAAPMIPTPVFSLDCYTWPWIKNYAGEISGGFTHFNPMSKIMWIDEALKSKMGY